MYVMWLLSDEVMWKRNTLPRMHQRRDRCSSLRSGEEFGLWTCQGRGKKTQLGGEWRLCGCSSTRIDLVGCSFGQISYWYGFTRPGGVKLRWRYYLPGEVGSDSGRLLVCGCTACPVKWSSEDSDGGQTSVRSTIRYLPGEVTTSQRQLPMRSGDYSARRNKSEDFVPDKLVGRDNSHCYLCVQLFNPTHWWVKLMVDSCAWWLSAKKGILYCELFP